jgi:hypothetical protein
MIDTLRIDGANSLIQVYESNVKWLGQIQLYFAKGFACTKTLLATTSLS